MLAAVAVAVSNVPGGSVIEVRRATATVFLHVLDADRPEGSKPPGVRSGGWKN